MRTGSFETDAQRASKTAEKRFKEIEKQAKETATSVSNAFAGLLSGALLGVGFGTAFGKFIEETKNAQSEQAQLAAVLKSTGNAAGFTAAELNKMASGMAGFVSEGDINRAQTRLLSYTGVVGDEFPRALQAAIDMSVRLGMTVEQSAETVGKALDIPSKGLTALSKQGFRFTEEQKKLVESLEATGRVAEAQDVVLKALESSYGGAAQAARETLGGALQALQNQIDDLMTGDGGSVDGLTTSINSLTDTLGSDETKASFAAFTSFLADMVREVVNAASVINATSFTTWLKFSGSEIDNPDRAIADIDQKISEFQRQLEVLDPEASLANKVNDFIWGDTQDLKDRIAELQKQREGLLIYLKNQPNPYAGVGETGAPTLDPIVTTGGTPPGGGGGGGGRIKERVDQGQKLIDQMNQQIALTGKLTEYEKLLEQVRLGSVTFKTQAQQDEALASAQTLDFIKEQNKAYEETQAHLKAMSKVSQETATEMDEFAREAARSIQDSLGDGLYGLLSGNFDDIGQKFAQTLTRMAADAAAANLAGALFGDYGKTGQIGGLLGGLAAGIFGNSISASSSYVSAGPAVGSWDGLSYFADGGYTGAGGKYDPAGIVHAGEYVIPADATRRLGVGFLDRLKGYADGGYVGASGMPSVSGGGTRVEIINNGTPQRVAGVQQTMDVRGEVISIVVEDLQKNGRSANAVRGVVGG
ncbi:phage tail length tape measure family protein [Achromobacter sp. ACRQX]|uniref:phage tail length tape measure family protein n=1 Tax=Achromobacter sp. ACRQX TaxID=2918181 RepID=UPI001EF292F1|nr:phage tail length tape measure family protein [Achromobacter sp. ACRQX]MCG7328065.1 phage tail length tape measure family protein [Achromobacter sp. ACRQX]